MATKKTAGKTATKKAAAKPAAKSTVKTANGNKAPQAKNDDNRKSSPLTVVPKEQMIPKGRTGKALQKKADKIRGVTKPVVEDDVDVLTAPAVETLDEILEKPVIDGSKDAEFEAEWIAELSAKGALVDESPDSLIDGALNPTGKKRTKIITTHLETAKPPRVKKVKGEKTEWKAIELPTFDDSDVELSPAEMKAELLRLRRLVDCLAQRIPLRLHLQKHMQK